MMIVVKDEKEIGRQTQKKSVDSIFSFMCIERLSFMLFVNAYFEPYVGYF